MSQVRTSLPITLLYSFSPPEVLKGSAFFPHSLELRPADSGCSKSVFKKEGLIAANRKVNKSLCREPSGGTHHLCLFGQCPWTVTRPLFSRPFEGAWRAQQNPGQPQAESATALLTRSSGMASGAGDYPGSSPGSLLPCALPTDLPK